MKRLLLILPLLFFSCSEEDPRPTIIEGTLVWDDGTPAMGIQIWFSGKSNSSVLNPGSGSTINQATLDLEDTNEFYLEIPAHADVDYCIVIFNQLFPDGTFATIAQSVDLDCGTYDCDRVAPGNHYVWEIILPRD